MRNLGPPPTTGDRVAGHALHEVLGAGGLATVYRATTPGGGVVALKIMNPEKTTEEQVRRIEREFHAMSAADHPCVVKVLGAGEHLGYPWLALEYVDGPTLEALVQSWESAPPPDRWAAVRELLVGLCRALGHVHDKGMVHRDLKPSNVLVASDGTVKLADFGSVKAPDQFTTNLTTAGSLVGTVAYMAPEQITEARVDPRTDLYALGATLYVMLTGRRPVEADSIPGYLAKHLMEAPIAPVAVNPDIPLVLSRVTMKLLEKDPVDRFQSAAQVIAALDGGGTEQGPAELLEREELVERLEQRISALKMGAGGAVAVVGEARMGRSAVLDAIAAQRRVDVVHLRFPEPGEPPEVLLPSTGPWLLIADDLHSADPAWIWALSGALKGQRERVLFIYSLRQSGPEMSAEVQRLVQPLAMDMLLDPSDRPLIVGPVSRRAVVTLLRQRGLRGAAAGALGRRLHGAWEGRIGAVLESLDAMAEAGWITETGDGDLALAVPLATARGAALPVLRARRQEVDAAIDALGPGARRRLFSLAILGGEADEASIDALAPGLGPETPLVAVERGEFGSILRLAAPDLADLIAERIPADEARALHGAAATLLQERHKRRPGAVAEQAAHHLCQAGLPHQAVPLLVLGASRALRRRRFAEAAALAQRAAGLRQELLPVSSGPEDPGQRALAIAGEALLGLGRPEDARSVLEAAVEADPQSVESQGRLALALVDLGLFAEGLLRAEGALARLERGSPVRFAVQRTQAEALVGVGRLDDARVVWTRVLAEARSDQSASREGSALLGRGRLELDAGNPADAASYVERSEALLQQGPPRPRALLSAGLAEIGVLDGRYRRAFRQLKLGRELIGDGQTDLQTELQVVALEALWATGRAASAQELTEEIIAQEHALPRLGPRWAPVIHRLALATLGPSALRDLPDPVAMPSAGPSSAARWSLWESSRLGWQGAPELALRHANEALDACVGPGLAGLRLEAGLAVSHLGGAVDLDALAEPVRKGLPEELAEGLQQRIDAARKRG